MSSQKAKNSFLATLFCSLFVSGCSYKNDCYNPKAKQSYEKEVCYSYDEALISDHRFVYMDKIVWMQYQKQFLVDARDFNITVNEKNATKVTGFRVLPSDHPLESFSNLLININFLKSFEKIESLSYVATNPQKEIKPQTLGYFSIQALNNILNLAKSKDLEANKTRQ